MTTGRPLIAVLLGTDHHPFSRLVGWVEELAADEDQGWFVQHGSTPLPDGLTGSAMLSAPALKMLLEQADVVVTHGGPGLIMEARAAGHVPIVVPRSPALGEHVDNHQELFAARVTAAGLVTTAADPRALRAAVDQALQVGRAAVEPAAAEGTAATRLGLLVDDLLKRRGATGPGPRRAA